MRRTLPILLLIFVAISCATNTNEERVILDFLNNRFGMFIHYNMGTFHAEQWAQPNHDPKSFNPTNLDCKQWADAAKSANMSYAVFTTKHHDGFCLWDSSVTDYDVASSSYDGDIVKEYADAFRAKGLKVGLYFSVWDRQHNIAKNMITPEGIEYTKTQLTELLTNYGEIICIVIDGWGSIWGRSPSFEELPYNVLADHIHSIQPNCLVINHSCKADLNLGQVVHYEATHGQHCPFNNVIPSQQGPTIQPAWFWEKGYEKLKLKPLDEILSELDFCNSHYANYLLNAAPNASGRMDDNVVERLAEVGKAWKRPKSIKKLAKPYDKNECIVTAEASYEGVNIPSNVLDANLFSVWQAPKDEKEPSIVLDFGKEESFNRLIIGETTGKQKVNSFIVEALVDNQWVEIVRGESIGHHKDYSFDSVVAQKFRFTVTDFDSAPPKIREITFVNYK